VNDVGNYVLWVVMACAVLGAIAAIRDPEHGLGKEFMEGLYSIGPIFVPVAGIMASVPYLSQLVESLVGPLFGLIGASPSMAATSVIAVDMGGYQLARELSDGNVESWIMAMTTGYMAGATIVFSIPVGLAMLRKEDHRYMALGVMAGILAVPIGVLVSSLMLIAMGPSVRSTATTSGLADHEMALELGTVLRNLTPLVIFVVTIALGLRLLPGLMIRGFMIFGRLVDALVKLALMLAIVDYFTEGFGARVFEWCGLDWRFAPIIADDEDRFRALEVAGYIGTMLAGAFPMVYLIKKHLGPAIEGVGRKAGLEQAGAAGILAASANILAMYRLVGEMRPRDKVLNIDYAVCAAFLLGDHLAFTANFQPSLIAAVLGGKLAGGIAGFALARWLSVPTAERLAAKG